MNSSLLKKLPKIDVLLSAPEMRVLFERYPYAIVKETVQEYIAKLRSDALADRISSMPSIGDISAAVSKKLENGDIYSLKRVINATGVVLHTNLGRAPLGREVAQHVADVAAGYCTLEYDVEKGERGSRYSHVEKLLCDITGAEAAMVVNNNAGAVFLILNTLAKEKKVAVSRGELVEIGGSFRVPEIMSQSGAELIEVGTTNKTHPEDYAKAIENGAEVLLKVHTSNFKMLGFTESVDIPELSAIAKPSGALVLYDLGAGFLFPAEHIGINEEGHVVGKCLSQGADIVCFSGDKLLGSSQAGVIVGRKELVDRIKKNHLTRMLRIDKLCLAALEMTLKYSVSPDLAKKSIPALEEISMTEGECRNKAAELAAGLKTSCHGIIADVVQTKDEAGGGSLPGVEIDSAAVEIVVPGISAAVLEEKLRKRSVPIITRVSRDSVLISPRTLRENDAEEIISALAEICICGVKK